jgi:hypothetical protein
MNNLLRLKKNDHHSYLWVGIFGIAFGFLEATVVVYLRQLYYPEGFDFPMIWASLELFRIELIRELSTLTMLLSIAILTGRNAIQRFAWFLYAFAIWDIFYYIALKILIGWPPSLLTWDLLFLIPVAWNGPVLAPVLCSLTMIGFTLTVVELDRKGLQVLLKMREWIMIGSGALIILITFIWDYTTILIRNGIFSAFPLSEDNLLVQEMLRFVPVRFNWGLFLLGELLIILGILWMGKRVLKKQIP